MEHQAKGNKNTVVPVFMQKAQGSKRLSANLFMTQRVYAVAVC